jgi:DNA-binding NtrC family response regulator
MREPSSYKLLVIDDEPALLRLMKSYLERLGYQVEAFGEGPAAWQCYKSAPKDYDLVIADLSMGDVDIEALIPQMPAMNKSVRVLVCSGRPYDPAVLPRNVQPHVDFLQKPFIPTMLADAVAGVLRNRTAARAS